MAGSLVFFQAELSLVIDANVWGGEQCLPSLKENRTFELAKTVKTSEGFLVMCYITCMLTVEMSNSSTWNHACQGNFLTSSVKAAA